MLILNDLTAENVSDSAKKVKSKALIAKYLMTVTNECRDVHSSREIKMIGKGGTYDFNPGELKQISLSDIEEVSSGIKKARKEYGFRALVNHESRGIVQDIAADMYALGSGYAARSAGKALLGVALASVSIGATAQALFGPEDYNKYFGQTFEQTLSRFMLGAPDHASLVPVVAGTAAGLAVGRLAVAFASCPRSAEERKNFQEYSDLRNAQSALKQLKKAVVKSNEPEKETKTFSTLSRVLQSQGQYR